MIQNTVNLLNEDHFRICRKLVFKTSFGQSEKWSSAIVGAENEGSKDLGFENLSSK